jgi:cyclopropane fatty-acyl-phospholipid synthase-like methyltransferase
LFEHTLFCAIDPSDRDAYVRALLRWLKPGGFFLAVHYMIPDKDGPPFGTDRDEILTRFSPHFELIEEWIPRSYPNRIGLERMFWWRRTQETGVKCQETQQ